MSFRCTIGLAFVIGAGVVGCDNGHEKAEARVEAVRAQAAREAVQAQATKASTRTNAPPKRIDAWDLALKVATDCEENRARCDLTWNGKPVEIRAPVFWERSGLTDLYLQGTLVHCMGLGQATIAGLEKKITTVRGNISEIDVRLNRTESGQVAGPQGTLTLSPCTAVGQD